MNKSDLFSFPYLQSYTAEDLFSLAIKQSSTYTRISMQVLHKSLTTASMPFIVTLLKRELPNVLLTECYNDDNLPFAAEVRNTELGHLFEHILLEYLCQLKIAKGCVQASYSGRTRWNWIRDPRGLFHISLTCGQADADILPIALEKTITLMKLILTTNPAPLFAPRRYFYSRNGIKNGKRKKLKVQS